MTLVLTDLAPSRTATLATLGLSSSAGVVLDYAFLGLYPGRFTARRAAFIGLLDLAGSQPPAIDLLRIGRTRRRIFSLDKEAEELMVACGAI